MGFYRQRTFGSFDPSKQLVAGRQMTVYEHELTGGDPIPMEVDEGIRRRLWMVEHAHYEEDYTPTPELTTHGPDRAWMDEADGVTATEGPPPPDTPPPSADGEVADGEGTVTEE
jgi:hypothetical protein